MPYKDLDKKRANSRARGRRYYAKNRKKLCAASRKYWALHGTDKNLKYKYGISEKEYQQLFQLQGGLCAICKQPPSKKRLAVDHDHRTGVVRGLLHVSCNMAIGLLRDDPFTIEQALQYVLKHRTLEK
jgi:hypothetical protein